MIIQTVKFETNLSEEELMTVAKGRLDQYSATPGLIEKFYCKYSEPNHFGGVLIWDSMESLKAFGETELAATIPEVYKVVGQPKVAVINSMFELRSLFDNAA